MRELPIPSKRLLLILLIPLGLMIIGIFIPGLKTTATILNFIILLITITDILFVYLNSKLKIDIRNNQIFNIGNPKNLDIEVVNRGNQNVYIELGVDLPKFWEQISTLSQVVINTQGSTKISLLLKPYRRGSFKINKLHYRTQSYIGLVYIYYKKNIDISLDVYPDFSGIKEYLKLSRSNRLFEFGIHKNRYKGHGTELDSLREYSRDDDAKFIDWKATSRLNRPVTKQFHMESQNDIIIALDCGRMMCGEQNRFSSLDYAINAVLTLAHVAISLGDSIRVIAFSDKIDVDLKPPKGADKFTKVVKCLTPLQPKFVESNYSTVFSYIKKTSSKRALILFISDIMDDINYNVFKGNFIYLSKRHQILFLLLKDTLIEEHSFKEVSTTDDFYNISVSRSLYLKRSKTINKLKLSGIDVLDVLPNSVTGKLIDRYLLLKSRNKL